MRWHITAGTMVTGSWSGQKHTDKSCVWCSLNSNVSYRNRQPHVARQAGNVAKKRLLVFEKLVNPSLAASRGSNKQPWRAPCMSDAFGPGSEQRQEKISGSQDAACVGSTTLSPTEASRGCGAGAEV